MKKNRFYYRTTVIRGRTRSDQLLEHLAFLPSTISREIKRTHPNSILKVTLFVTGLLLAAHKKNEANAKQGQAFLTNLQKRKK